MKNIKLNNHISIDIEKLIQSRMVILANSGGGKSYAIRKIAEEAVGQVQVIIIDPEGEFASLREKFDFILAGKNADVPAEVRSAGLLATKLLELGKSAVIDLYELHPSERQRFVKLFCESMVNCPKELYHPVIVILDEAHEYVPEGKPSEATWAVEALASKGRKRGQCLIPASQRISKLSKNVSAECNNKLIGRASQDIDMKRAGDELGFAKESLVQLRQLKPGEFFAFGPAISEEVVKVKIGEVKTSHAKVGYKGTQKAPPPSAMIKKVLGELKDLPAEAEKEAKTTKELQERLAAASREISRLGKIVAESESNPVKKISQEAVDLAVSHALKMQEEKFWEERNEWLRQIQNWFSIIKGIGDAMAEWEKTHKIPGNKSKPWGISTRTPDIIGHPTHVFSKSFDPANDPYKNTSIRDNGIEIIRVGENVKFALGEKKVYSFLHANPDRAFTKVQVAAVTGYSASSGGFSNSLSKLASAGLISRDNAMLQYKALDESLLLPAQEYTIELWFSKLGKCEREVLRLLLDHPDRIFTTREVAELTNYSATSGGFSNSLSRLNTLELAKRSGGTITINSEILNI